MPIEKSIRVSERKAQRNVAWRSSAKTHLSKARSLIDKGDLDSAKEASTEAMSVLDTSREEGRHSSQQRRTTKVQADEEAELGSGCIAEVGPSGGVLGPWRRKGLFRAFQALTR